MKCIILANNSNNRYKDYHTVLTEREGDSWFKRTIINNMPYCTQYIILCGSAADSETIRFQMSQIRDLDYQVLISGQNSYREDIIEAMKDMEQTEIVCVIPCEMNLEGTVFHCKDIQHYRKHIIRAEQYAMSGKIAGLICQDNPTGIYCFQKEGFCRQSQETDILQAAEKIEVLRNTENSVPDGNREKDFCVKLNPAFKDYLWGGVKLREKYGKQCDFDIIAESWELSAHEAGQSIIADGHCQGMLFKDYLAELGKENLGWKCSDMSEFPILIKFIDAKNPLSVQVHPDDAYALMYEDEYGKNEMWYILDCEEGAGIYCGFKRDTSAEEVRERIENNTILEILNWIPVQKGEVYYIKAGTVHAIGGGIMICEIQQSSNCTYRLYDYDRVDKNGNKRELHIDKALQVLDYHQYAPQTFAVSERDSEAYSTKILASCKYFQCVSCVIHGSMQLQLQNASFRSVICVAGQGTIRDKDKRIEFKIGDSLFLPKNNHAIEIEGNCELVITEL